MNESIKEWDSINKIEILEDRYFKKSGIKPNNISHWDSSKNFQDELRKIYNIEESQLEKNNIFDYTFSYDLMPAKINKIIKKIGYDNCDMLKCLVTPTGTVSISCALNWLKEKYSIKKIGVLCPAYFTVFHSCKNIGLSFEKIYMQKSEDGIYSIPKTQVTNLVKHGKIEALFLTDPVYSTSLYITDEDISYISIMMDLGIKVICDCCSSINHSKIINTLSKKDGFISIHEPHKLLTINSQKFSTICFDEKEIEFFESWADVIYGGLCQSNFIAINHYLSNNYEECLNYVLKIAKNNYIKIKTLLEKYENILIDPYNESLYISCYFLKIPSNVSNKSDFIRNFIRTTNCSFIPGIRNQFNPNLCFCFRINLTRCDDETINSIDKIFELLNN